LVARRSSQFPAQALVHNFKLVGDDAKLAGVPDWPKSSVPEDRRVAITNQNFRGLWRLSDELGFGLLRTRLAETNLSGAAFDGTFAFTANSATLKCEVGQAAALSPAVREQLSRDSGALFQAIQFRRDRFGGSSAIQFWSFWAEGQGMVVSILIRSTCRSYRLKLRTRFSREGHFRSGANMNFWKDLQGLVQRFLSGAWLALLAEHLASPAEGTESGIADRRRPRSLQPWVL
jgi:hypothetical protein